jgi:uncharacterized protein (DUF3084 family)
MPDGQSELTGHEEGVKVLKPNRDETRGLAEELELLGSEQRAAIEQQDSRMGRILAALRSTEADLTERRRALTEAESAFAERERQSRAEFEALAQRAEEVEAKGAQIAELQQELGVRERQLQEGQERVTMREREVEERAKAVAARERLADRVGPAWPGEHEPADSVYNIGELEQRVTARAAEFPGRTAEWQAYLFELRAKASPDGSIPDTLTGLVEDVFAPLV